MKGNFLSFLKERSFKITFISSLSFFILYNKIKKSQIKSTLHSSKPDNQLTFGPLWRSKIRQSLSNQSNVLFISGSCNEELSEEIADRLGVNLIKPEIRVINGEVYMNNIKNIDAKEIYIIQPTSPPVNDNLLSTFSRQST